MELHKQLEQDGLDYVASKVAEQYPLLHNHILCDLTSQHRQKEYPEDLKWELYNAIPEYVFFLDFASLCNEKLRQVGGSVASWLRDQRYNPEASKDIKEIAFGFYPIDISSYHL